MQDLLVLSALLQYPEAELIDALAELQAALDPALALQLQGLFAELGSNPLIKLQQNYLATFEQGRGCSLHLFEHIHGESRERGPAMVDLMEEYKRYGLFIDANELPDFVPLFLEFLSQIEREPALPLLGSAVHVLALIGQRLGNSPYAAIFEHLVALSPVAAQPLVEPPVRDMDEAMEQFGPGADGVEPLLRLQAQPITFHPRVSA